MRRSRTIQPQQIETARRLLRSLPQKDFGKSREETTVILEKDFRKAMERGYSPKEISAMLKKEGVSIPASLLKIFLANADDSPVKAVQKTENKSAPKPERHKKQKTTQTTEEFTITPDTPDEDL